MRPELEQLLNTQKTSPSNGLCSVETPRPAGTAKENLISPNPHQGTPSCRLTATLIINYTISMGISTKQSYKS